MEHDHRRSNNLGLIHETQAEQILCKSTVKPFIRKLSGSIQQYWFYEQFTLNPFCLYFLNEVC